MTGGSRQRGPGVAWRGGNARPEPEKTRGAKKTKRRKKVGVRAGLAEAGSEL